MSKIYMVYGPMNSSKTATLIMNAFNYREEGQNPVILKPSLDVRDGVEPIIKSRSGMTGACTLIDRTEDLFRTIAKMSGATDTDIEWYDKHIIPVNSGEQIKKEYAGEGVIYVPGLDQVVRHTCMINFCKRFEKRIDCVLIDEVQFITEEQAEQLMDIADYMDIPVMAFGLRNDFKGNPFPASVILMAQAEVLRENIGICWCGSKATHVLRIDENGKVDKHGPQIKVGGNDTYRSVCRFHFKAGESKKPVLDDMKKRVLKMTYPDNH